MKKENQKKENQEMPERSLEENFEQMEVILEKMADEELSLEEAFAAYSEGMQVLKTCKEQIDLVEKKVMVLNEAGELEELT